MDLFFPPVCLLCGRGDGWFEKPTCCFRCWQSIQRPRRLKFPTRRKHAALAFCCGTYAGALRTLVTRAKFNADPLAVSLLSSLLRSMAPSIGLRRVDCLTSIPPQRSRLRTRGIDLPGYLAEKLAKSLQIPYERDLLMRVRSTKSQREVSKAERLRNLRGAFRVQRHTGHTSVLVVDDVFTTGATAWAAVRAFRQAGIHRVDFLAAAAAP
ncbi:MAG: ComF family protein [Pseudomonadota bacterium]